MKKSYSFYLKLSATLFCLLLGYVAQSEIVYRDISPDKSFQVATASADQLTPMDLDQDGSDELKFSYIDNGSTWSINVNNTKLGVDILESSNFAIPVSTGTLIGPNSSNWVNAGRYVSTDANLNFAGLGDKYIAVRFVINNAMRYAWIRINVDALTRTVIVKDFAYESIPNKFIFAGDKPDNHLFNNTLVNLNASVTNEGNGFSLAISYFNSMLVCEKRKLSIAVTNNNSSLASCTLKLPASDFTYQLISVDGKSSINNAVLLVNNIPAGTTSTVELYYNISCDNYADGTSNAITTKVLTIGNASGATIFSDNISVSSGYLTNDPLQTSGFTNLTGVTSRVITRVFDLQNTSVAPFGGSFMFRDLISQTNGGNRYEVVGLQIKDISGATIASIPSIEIKTFTIGQIFEYVFDNLHLNANTNYKIYQDVRLNICPSGNTFNSMVRLFYGCGSNQCRQINNGYSTSILQSPDRALLKAYHTIDESYDACFETSAGNDNKIKHKYRLINEGTALASEIRFTVTMESPYQGFNTKLSLSKVTSITITPNPSNVATLVSNTSVWLDGRNWSGTITDFKNGTYNQGVNPPTKILYKSDCFDETSLLWMLRSFNINQLAPGEFVDIEFLEEFCCTEYSSEGFYGWGNVAVFNSGDATSYNNGCEVIVGNVPEIFPNTPSNHQPFGQYEFSSTPIKYYKDLFGNKDGFSASVTDLVNKNTYEFITNNSDFGFGALHADKNSFLWSVDLVVDGDLIPGLTSASTSNTDYNGNIFFEHGVNKQKIYPSSIQVIDNDNDKLFQFLGLNNSNMNPIAVRAYFDIRTFDFDPSPTAVEQFDLNTPVWTDHDRRIMEGFINNYNIHFSVTAVCGRAPLAGDLQYAPDIRLVTSFYPSSNCLDCRMNLSTFSPSSGKVRVNCPGCVTVGVLTYPTTFTRMTVGNQDLDNDGLQTSVDVNGEFPYSTASIRTFKNGIAVPVNDGMDLNIITEGDIMESTSGGSLWSPGGGAGQYSGDGTSVLEQTNGASFLKYLVRKDYMPSNISSILEIKVDNTYPIIVEYKQGGIRYRLPITNASATTNFQDPSTAVTKTFPLIQKGGDGFLVLLPIDYLKNIKDGNGANILPSNFKFRTDDSFEITWYYYLKGNFSSIKHSDFIEVDTRCFMSGYPKDINVGGETDPYNTSKISSITDLNIYSNYMCEANSGIFKAADYENYSYYYDFYNYNDNACNKSITNVISYLNLGNENNARWQSELFPFETRYLALLPNDFEVFFPTGYILDKVAVRLYSTIVSEQGGYIDIVNELLKVSDYTTSPAILGGVVGTMVHVNTSAQVIQDGLLKIDDGYEFDVIVHLTKGCPIPTNDFSYGYRPENFLGDLSNLNSGPQTKIIDYTASIKTLERTSDALVMSYYKNYFPVRPNIYGIVSQASNINNPAVIYASKINNQFEFEIGLDILSGHRILPTEYQTKNFSKSYIRISSATVNGGMLNVSAIEYSADNGTTWLPMNSLGSGVFLLEGSFTIYKFRLNTSYQCGNGNSGDQVKIEYGYFCDPNVSVSVANGAVSPAACYASNALIDFTPLSSAIEYVSVTSEIDGCNYKHHLLARSLASGNIGQIVFTADLPAEMTYVNGTSRILYAINLNDTDPSNDITGTLEISDPIPNGNLYSFVNDLGTINNNGILDVGGINSTFTLEFETTPTCNFTTGQIQTSMSAISYCGKDLGTASNPSATFSKITGCAGPEVTLIGSDRVCLGSYNTLTAQLSNNSGTVQYTWYKLNGNIRELLSGPSASNTYTYNNLATATTFEVVVSSNTSTCTAKSSLAVAVNNPPAVSITSPLEFCIGSSPLILTGSPVGGLFTGNGVSLTSTGAYVFTSSIAGNNNITYTYTDPSSGCTNAIKKIIVVSSCCKYALATTEVACGEDAIKCITLKAIKPVDDGIKGMDFMLRYDRTLMRPTGIPGRGNATLGNVVLNGGMTNGMGSYAMTERTISGTNFNELNVSIFYTGQAPAAADFDGIGDVICIEFKILGSATNSLAGTSIPAAIVIGDFYQGGFSKGVVDDEHKVFMIRSCVENNGEGAISILKNNLLKGRIYYHNDVNAPLRYDAAATPTPYLKTTIKAINTYYGAGFCNPTNNPIQTTDLNGSYSIDMTGANGLKIEREIVGDYYNSCTNASDAINQSGNVYNPARLLLAINGYDAYLMESISTMRDPADVVYVGDRKVPTVFSPLMSNDLFPTAFQMIAADVNMDRMVRAVDITLVQERAVSKLCEYPQVWNYNLGIDPAIYPLNTVDQRSLDWRFIDKAQASSSYSYNYRKSTKYPFPLGNTGIAAAFYWRDNVPQPTFCLMGPWSNPYSCKSYNQYFDIHAIMLGDIDGSWRANLNNAQQNLRTVTDRQVIINAKDKRQIGVNTYRIPVSFVSQDPATVSLDFALDYNENELSIQSVGNLEAAVKANAQPVYNDFEQKQLLFTSFTMTGFNSSTPIYYLDVVTKNGDFNANMLGDGDAYLNGEKVSLVVDGATITGVDNELLGSQYGFELIPNPAASIGEIIYNIKAGASAKIEVYNTLGQVIAEYKDLEGQGSIQVGTSDWSSGMYQVILFTENSQKLIKKWVIQK